MKMKFPFEAYINGKKVKEWFVYTDGESLVARVLPKVRWPRELKKEITEVPHPDSYDSHGPDMDLTIKLDKPIIPLEEPIHLHLFATPVSEYKDLEKQIHEMKNKSVNMGDLPTLRRYRQSEIREKLEKDFFYDLLAVGTYMEYRVVKGYGRLSTTQESKVPFRMTLDELKLLAIEDLELTREQAQKIKAKITPMADFGITSSGGGIRSIVAGFTFGKTEDGRYNYGVMGYDNGQVSHYHGDSKEELRKALGV